jgi:tRNA G18 (ribose-2'-O)-methylase SpoU
VPPQLIADPADPRLDPFRAIRERDLTGRDGQFIIEGEVVLRHALAHGRFAIRLLLVAEARTAALADVLEALPDGCDGLVASRAVIEAVAGFDVHRGVLALGEIGNRPPAAALLGALPEKALVVAGIGIANHDNMGGLFRNAAAFGADLVALDGTSCDPLYRKAIRVSVGAVLSVPFARGGPGAALVEDLAAAGFACLSLSPAGAHALADVPIAPRTALILGAEGPGLPADILARTTTVSIPMPGRIDSLNLATSAGIALQRIAERRGASQS